jgi:hypothetical protein
MENLKSISIQYLPNIEEQDGSRQLVAGKFLFPGFNHEFRIFAKQLPGGKVRYITGLEEDDVPESRKEEVVQAKQELEKSFGKGTLDPTNEAFWKDLKLVLNKKTTFLDINSNPEHKLFYYVIRGNGIPEIAATHDQAITGDKTFRWYLIEPDDYANLSVVDDRVIDKATAKLVELDTEKTFDDLMLVHKNLITADRGVTRQTPRGTLYKDLSNFIKGKIVKTDKRRTPSQFLEAIEMLSSDKKRLYVTAYVRDALYFNYLGVNPENQFFNTETKTVYGSSVEAAVNKLSNPAFQDELENLKMKVEKKWIN